MASNWSAWGFLSRFFFSDAVDGQVLVERNGRGFDIFFVGSVEGDA